MKERKEVLDFGMTFPDVYVDAPFHDDNWVLLRYRKNKKAFAWTYEKNGHIWVNVKVDPQWRDLWRNTYPSVLPAYHQNKEHWNSIILDGTVPEEEIKRMIAESYDLIVGKAGKKRENIEIRQERPEDYEQTERVTREAFWNQYAPGCCEHYLLHMMRNCPAFVPELDLVAVYEGRIVGNAACAEGKIQGDNGKQYKVLSLGPISVLPEYQGQGIGRALIAQVMEAARELGYRAILLCGDPAYYSRHGFEPAERYGIRTADHMYAAALQVLKLCEGALEEMSGYYLEDQIYEVDDEACAQFDRRFPEKEKISGIKMQQRFQELVSMRRMADDTVCI